MTDDLVLKMVHQLRAVTLERIMQNPLYVTVTAYPLKDNGFGIQVPNITQTPITSMFGPVRVASDTTPVRNPDGEINGVGIQNSFILIGTYNDTWIKKNLIIQFSGRRYQIFEPTSTLKYGYVTGIVARLNDVTASIESQEDWSVAHAVVGGNDYAVGFEPDVLGD